MINPIFKIQPTVQFKKDLKNLLKKYPSILEDIESLSEQLTINPIIGKSLGNGFYKIRVAITSKGKGKSCGARVITKVKIVNSTVYLICLFDKSEMETISISELKTIFRII